MTVSRVSDKSSDSSRPKRTDTFYENNNNKVLDKTLYENKDRPSPD